jgi:tRNA dimethylallyltransferase
MAARLKPGDTQRIARALEVIEATGISLAEWQQRAAPPLFPDAVYHCAHLELPRETLYARLNARFVAMMKNGALEEVRALMGLGLPPALPILRAHGVPELMAHLNGTLSLAEATEKAQQNTRNYAKRQMTWLRNQMKDSLAIDARLSADAQIAAIFSL